MKKTNDMEEKSEKENSIENLSLNELIGDITQRLSSIEHNLSQQQKIKDNNSLLEFLKVIFGGWPVFGLLFLILFYAPLKEVFKSIPDKIKSANEIQVGNVSLKTTFKEVAEFQGFVNLGNVIPKLSSSSIENLLKAPKHSQALISFTNSSDIEFHSHINMPSNAALSSLTELEYSKLITLSGSMNRQSEVIDGKELKNLINDIKNKFPGSEGKNYNNNEAKIRWKLDNEISRSSNLPLMSWKLTEDGQKAVSIILEAVSKELSDGNNTQ
ncbi:hypothetical protein [Aquimarina sp. Aq78]|uniref:hypothetical protein n=1 Tax=Aquimarina sp. Aq78 TaxID=1191889 RepID=UPI000D10CC4A|nr:hypothetical protein [Aquimarina sp. Aq78]